ncbi:autophagy-related protein Atg10 [Venturia nashicola]|uniref:Ubiquitin-like-conjugating enzyme ATG10 n=1 Tax=Venturia nashicola TaxID=86259 RepID=A0A4Z1PWU0_9PEZI|nr:autophagy-related protein Atg10 [Venturia nashicola]TLD39669.1 autophagy-related protein Atg10 [Venturia nashicola]
MASLPNYPFLDNHEFRLICQGFAASFEDWDTDPGDWQNVQYRTLENNCFLRIERATTSSEATHTTQLPDSESNEIGGSDGMIEETDEEALPRLDNRVSQQDEYKVQYDIFLSPSYSVPVLYLTVRDSSGRLLTDVETVYLLLVPEVYRRQMRHVGVMGGLSMANHPVTDIPTFFIHPCQTADALREVARGRTVSSGEYLLVWMGIIGGSVGLNAPVSLGIQQTMESNFERVSGVLTKSKTWSS